MYAGRPSNAKGRGLQSSPGPSSGCPAISRRCRGCTAALVPSHAPLRRRRVTPFSSDTLAHRSELPQESESPRTGAPAPLRGVTAPWEPWADGPASLQHVALVAVCPVASEAFQDSPRRAKARSADRHFHRLDRLEGAAATARRLLDQLVTTSYRFEVRVGQLGARLDDVQLRQKKKGRRPEGTPPRRNSAKGLRISRWWPRRS
jgi:hypothetical protein